MAPKDEPKEAKVEEVVRVISGRTVDERVASLISEQKDFPDPASIEIHESFVDVFKPPKWCDTENYAYAWVDPNDDTQMDRAIRYDYWQIVTRSNHPGANNSDFRSHGAVEKRGLILVYRPMDLEKRLRYLGVKKHMDMFAAQKEGDKGPNWERSMEVGEDVPASGFKPFVGEEAGGEGIKPL
jgi:hypothetical protein